MFHTIGVHTIEAFNDVLNIFFSLISTSLHNRTQINTYISVYQGPPNVKMKVTMQLMIEHLVRKYYFNYWMKALVYYKKQHLQILKIDNNVCYQVNHLLHHQ